MGILHQARKFFWGFGLDINRYNAIESPLLRRKRLFEHFEISKLIDVGANTGQFATEMRKDLGFRGEIHSFEPLSSAYATLMQQAKQDPDWFSYNFALGDMPGEESINVSANLQSSSMLAMLPAHLEAAPESEYTGTETIQIKTLDSVFDDIYSPGDKIYLKVDTQGYESKVIAGAANSLDRICTIQLELALTPLYEDEALFIDVLQAMQEKGFELASLETGYANEETGQLLQVDGIFHREPV